MKVVFLQDVSLTDKLPLARKGQALDLDEGTARDLIAAGKASHAPKPKEAAPAPKEDAQAADRKTKPHPGPTETK